MTTAAKKPDRSEIADARNSLRRAEEHLIISSQREICHGCGAKWADDEGGKPEWVDPPEWEQARAALNTGGSNG